MHRTIIIRAALAVMMVVGLAACATSDAATDAVSDDGAAGIVEEGDPTADGPAGGTSPALGQCLPGASDCEEASQDPDTADTNYGEESLEDQRAAAPDLLGVAETDLPSDVRVSRRGAQSLVLTEDYVLGRLTVELDADVEGVFRVVSVTIELPEGPETFTS